MSFESDLEFLQNEFSAGDDSFLIQLRIDLHWDRTAFNRLTDAMLRHCRAQTSEEKVSLWIAQGFWYLSTWVRDWTTHPDFPRPEPPEYYERAYSRLYELADVYFAGDGAWLNGTGFDPL